MGLFDKIRSKDALPVPKSEKPNKSEKEIDFRTITLQAIGETLQAD